MDIDDAKLDLTKRSGADDMLLSTDPDVAERVRDRTGGRLIARRKRFGAHLVGVSCALSIDASFCGIGCVSTHSASSTAARNVTDPPLQYADEFWVDPVEHR